MPQNKKQGEASGDDDAMLKLESCRNEEKRARFDTSRALKLKGIVEKESGGARQLSSEGMRVLYKALRDLHELTAESQSDGSSVSKCNTRRICI